MGLPVGKWKVEFANGVKEVCHIGNGGESTVEEPRRRSNGIAEVKGGSVIIRFHDDRVERGRGSATGTWSNTGSRVTQLPTVTPVLGIAEPAP